MDRKPITFFKLISPYSEDITKNCGLVGQELDTNFLNLKQMDIINAYRDGYNIVLERVDGNKAYVDLTPLLSNVTTDFTVAYDSEEGRIIIKYNGQQAVIDGLVTKDNFDDVAMSQVISNSTLYGKGTNDSPLSISPVTQTGMFAPVQRLIDLTDTAATLPSCSTLIKGDRYVTRELVDDFGKLYDYNAVKRLESDLQTEGKGWRVPTKEDWDGMLNAIEPCDEYKNHDSINGNIQCGKFAGKLLKSKKYWKLASGCTITCNTYIGDNSILTDGTSCPDTTPTEKYITPAGVDAFGFSVIPAGYGDGCQLNGYFKERALFWTNTASHVSDVYVKRFDYDKTTVVQEIVNPNTIASIRLVKDYDGSNHFDVECILGQDYHTVLMPDENSKTGFKIWTDVNVSFTNCAYCPNEPNGGLGLPIESTYPTYYIVEWDGFRWLKHEMQEGDSVVLLTGINGDSNVEYRVIDGELQSVTSLVYTLVKEEYDPQIEDLQNQICTVQNNVAAVSQNVSNLQTQLNDTNEKLNQEIADRTKADSDLQTDINTKYNDLVAMDAKISAQLSDEAGERAKQDALLWNGINNESANRQEADRLLWNSLNDLSGYTSSNLTSLSEQLATEKEERVTNDRTLNTKIDNEINRATGVENTLNVAIKEEINRATTAENDLNNKVNTLTSNVQTMINEVNKNVADSINQLNQNLVDAINTINGGIAEEITNRENGDKRLSDRIDALNSKVDENISGITSDFTTQIADLNTRVQDEIERAMEAERTITNNLNSEIAQRKAADDEIKNQHAQDVNTLTTNLNNEIARSTKEDEIIKGKLISKEGHTFDCQNGVLTLVTDNPENTISIKLDSNYGTF